MSNNASTNYINKSLDNVAIILTKQVVEITGLIKEITVGEEIKIIFKYSIIVSWMKLPRGEDLAEIISRRTNKINLMWNERRRGKWNQIQWISDIWSNVEETNKVNLWKRVSTWPIIYLGFEAAADESKMQPKRGFM